MSGEKTGVIVPFAPLTGPVLLLGGAAIFFGMATRGMFRLGKQTYDRIDAHIEEAVARDLQEQLQRIEAYRSEWQTYEASQKSQEVDPAEEEKRLEEARHAELIEKVQQLTEHRKTEEKEKGLRTQVSQEFENRLADLQSRYRTRSQTRQPSKVFKAGGPLVSIINDIESILKEIEIYDSLFAKEKRAALAYSKRSARAYGIIKNEVNTKLDLIQKCSNPLFNLNTQYNKLMKHPLFEQYGKQQEKESVQSSFKRCVGVLEQSPDSDETILQQFRGEVDMYLQKTRVREMDERFQKNKDRLLQTMADSGYKPSGERDLGSRVRLTYRSKTEKQREVAFNLKKPACEDDSIDDFAMQVAEAGFATEAERQAEGKRIMKEIESTGIRVDYHDLTATIDPQTDREMILRNVKNQIVDKHQLKAEDVNVTWSSKADLMINGTRVTTANKSIVNVVNEYLQQTWSPLGKKEPERLKEEH